MCLAVPGKILDMVDRAARVARVNVLGIARTINLGLLDEVLPGDWVLVRMGVAVERITEAEAVETVRLFEELESLLSAKVQAPKAADL